MENKKYVVVTSISLEDLCNTVSELIETRYGECVGGIVTGQGSYYQALLIK